LTDTALQRIKEPAALPYAVTFPLQAAVLDERLYLTWAEADNQAAWLGALDRDGRQSLLPVKLPLGYVGSMAACAGKLCLVATRAGEADPYLVVLDPGGVLDGKIPLPVGEAMVRWPRLVCSTASTCLYWELGGKNPAVCVAAWDEDRLGEVIRVDISAEGGSPASGAGGPVPLAPGAAVSDALEAVPFAKGIVLGRVPSSLAGIELIQVPVLTDTAPGNTAARPGFSQPAPAVRFWVDTSYPTSLALAATSAGASGEYLALAWVSNPTPNLLVQVYNNDLALLGTPRPPVSFKPPAIIGSAHFIGGTGSSLALNLQVLVDQDPRHALGTISAGDRQIAARTASQFIGLYAVESRQASAFLSVSPAGTSFNTGGWIGSRLLLVHGERQPVVSIYQISS
jgi:hypothetical protein